MRFKNSYKRYLCIYVCLIFLHSILHFERHKYSVFSNWCNKNGVFFVKRSCAWPILSRSWVKWSCAWHVLSKSWVKWSCAWPILSVSRVWMVLFMTYFAKIFGFEVLRMTCFGEIMGFYVLLMSAFDEIMSQVVLHMTVFDEIMEFWSCAWHVLAKSWLWGLAHVRFSTKFTELMD